MGFLNKKTINDIKISDDKLAILFVCDDGNHIAQVDADCCSYTWVESIELPVSFPCKVIESKDLDLGKEPVENDEYEYLQFYGYKITTDKGDIVIDYRNEPNGYYGGDLCWPNEGHYGGVYGQAESKFKWVDVEDASL